jgi:hypothetical protein
LEIIVNKCQMGIQPLPPPKQGVFRPVLFYLTCLSKMKEKGIGRNGTSQILV